jgi:hypothetical protein
MFASTAMPTVSTMPARPGSVIVAPMLAMTPRMMTRLTARVTTATTPPVV